MNSHPLAQGPANSSQVPVVPALEEFATANPGLFAVSIAVVAGLLVLGIVAAIPTARRAPMALGRLLAGWWRAGQNCLMDLWARLRTPLEKRGTLEQERGDWERELNDLRRELSESRELAERRRQEINNNANEFQRYRKKCEANHRVDRSDPGARKPNAEWLTKIDLRIECEDTRGLVGMGPWVLKNWGPGVAYKIYATTTDPDSKLEEEHKEHLNPKESLTLFRSYPGRFSAMYLGDAPRIRVTYEDAGGKECEDFLEIPSGVFSSSLGAKKRIK